MVRRVTDMTSNKLMDIVAARKLYFFDDKKKEIAVLIGKPQRQSDSSDYYCLFQVVGIGDEEVRHATGIDAVQAMQLAMKMIGAYLYSLNQHNGGRLRWEGDETGDLGFPVS